ncbi:MAG: Asp-tRNA(Asn)/Glu-tRNA(Gln) amidotransferase subunit GatB [Planctomycetota bacterium]
MSLNLHPTIGLEVHVQLMTRTKLFSPAAYAAGAEPNTRVHAIDLGLPGTLPVMNAAALALAVRAALALEGELPKTSRFARKHYFYPDLPKGYQISQYDEPYCRGGRVPLGDGRFCALQRIHLEDDAGKLTHTDMGTLVDLDRAGAPLIEIVSMPELHEPDDAHAFLVSLREILRFCGVSDCDMELGTLRCDANVSLAEHGMKLGTKVEIKNLNSFKMVQRALEYEIRRQTAVLSAGGRVVQETRLWNDEKAETRSMRQKEFAEDYRYFADPDLPPLHVTAELVAEQRALLGELPWARRERYARQFALQSYDVEILTQDKATGDWFERAVLAGADPKAACNWLIGDVQKHARTRGCSLDELPLTPHALCQLLATIARGTLTVTTGKQALQYMVLHGTDVDSAIAALSLLRIVDDATLSPWIDAAIAHLPLAAADVRLGRMKPLDALKGHVMRATKGKADPQRLEELLLARLQQGS